MPVYKRDRRVPHVHELNKLNQPADFSVSVEYRTLPGVTGTSATAGSDYVAASGVLEFPAGTTRKEITLTINGDSGYENPETFILELFNAVGRLRVASVKTFKLPAESSVEVAIGVCEERINFLEIEVGLLAYDVLHRKTRD